MKRIALWLPRGRHHDLAMSLGLIELPRAAYCEAIKAAEAEAISLGCAVSIVRVSPSRIVREMEILGLQNTTAERAQVYDAMNATLARLHTFEPAATRPALGASNEQLWRRRP